ncbi:preprotein translocase subunit SecE [Lutibaculum baratangense]|uniref:Protein translocase subunit SecE n=1 Tax=Lutibaculum baratangense AMV1 TaxID=631454 RepID=V4TP61_9HYPH|nr:preprotein translocase subunit SecE [Lutibaculum baratangense]ESR27473.1 Preprotein translocase subunit SecE [Lutibaculum baratangense AMV1]
MAKTNPFQFLQQVRAEGAKVTWPSRRETAITTVMVFILSAVASLFFFVADQFFALGVELLLGIGM